MKSGTNFDIDTTNFFLSSGDMNLFQFGTAQTDQGNELTVSAWRAFDEIWDGLPIFDLKTTNIYG